MADASKTDTNKSIASKKILMVDDDVRIRELLQRYLSEQGFNIKTAGDAKEMDTALAADSFDLFLLLSQGDHQAVWRESTAPFHVNS